MRVTFAHLCDYATISREGKLSVLGIFDHVNVLGVPTQLPQLFLVFGIEMSSSELNRDVHARIQLASADGEKSIEFKFSFRVDGQAKPGDTPKVPQMIPIAGLPLQAIGTHQFSLFLNENHQCDIVFDVRQAGAQGATA